MLTVAKFGGSSLADGDCFRNVREILSADAGRKAVVVSAPGRRFADDEKVTDLLYRCYALRASGGDWHPVWETVCARFLGIRDNLGILPELERELGAVEASLAAGTVSREALASRGEYISARLLAAFLGWEFLDSADWLRFTPDGRIDTVQTYGRLHRLAQRPFVTPGFYGALPDGTLHTFSRGGSDITGALAAAALDADLYENWTDVPGILMADPKIYPEAKPIAAMTYRELTELSSVGTQVLHEGAVAPVREQGIPLRICSTKEPAAPGTRIMQELPDPAARNTVLSVAGRRHRVLVSGNCLRAGDFCRDFFTEIPGKQSVSLAAEDLLESGELLGEFGEVRLQDGVAAVAVIFAEGAERGACAAELLMALRRENIPAFSILRPFGSHTLLLSVPDVKYKTAVRTLCRTADRLA